MTGRDKDDYAVGYGKPPKRTRFKKGQSGNPRGRPKGARNFATDLDYILDAPMTVSENGKPKTVSTQMAALMRLREKALKGEPRALDRMLAMADERSVQKQTDAVERTLTTNEEDILKRFTETVSRNQSSNK